jgi:hypothetical protein
VEQTGWLQLSEEQLRGNEALPSDQKLKRIDAREIIYPGKNHEGWWNTERLIQQVCQSIAQFDS